MTDVRIKRLAPGDLGILRQMNDLFADVFEMDDEYRRSPPSDRYLLRLLSKDTFIALAAMRDDVLIGATTAYVLDKFEQQRSEIFIYDLAVSEPDRRQGVATQMLTELRYLATDIGAWVVIIQADDGDEPPTNLYSKLGSKEIALSFDLTPLDRT